LRSWILNRALQKGNILENWKFKVTCYWEGRNSQWPFERHPKQVYNFQFFSINLRVSQGENTHWGYPGNFSDKGKGGFNGKRFGKFRNSTGLGDI